MSSRDDVRKALTAHFQAEHASKTFKPGETYVPVSGKVCDANDMLALGEAVMDLWLTAGRFTREFEKKIAAQFGLAHALFVNSGSSANLLALSALGLKAGDEVITVAAGFPTTVAPILQNGLVPVFIDVELDTYNANLASLEGALTTRTRAIVLAHTLGNPFRADLVAAFAKKHGLYLVEDCCDALGSTIAGQHVGTFGDIATVSFYPAHHITTGEGGAVLTANARLRRRLESLRDWGRDCWCETGKENTCGKRFDQKFGELPKGYDHKYVYTEVGYNLKATDMQAALGLSQLAKLPGFIAKRKENFQTLHALLSQSKTLRSKIILPQASAGTDPSWFGFPIRCLPGVDRTKLVRELEGRKIGTRLLFAGNMAKQPAFANAPHRLAEKLLNTDTVMNDVFWLGVYPGLGVTELSYVAETLEALLR